MSNHVVTPGIVATLKAMMRRPELFGIPKPVPVQLPAAPENPLPPSISYIVKDTGAKIHD